MERILVSGPWITQKEIDYVADAVTNAWHDKANIFHDRFENAFAKYLGVKHAVALPSCTSAIHLSLAALGVGPGDEVIVPEATWIASCAPVTYVGATPVFADIDSKTWCISAQALERRITSRTKAVIPVDLYGSMPDMDSIRAIARQRKIAIIEDAAEAIGSEYRGKRSGSFGDTGVFSFHGSKTLTTGEGGLLVTDRDDIYERVIFLRDHGRRSGDKQFWNTEVGFKYKMSSMQAALGLAQLERVDELVDRKRQIFEWYRERLDGIDGFTLNYEAPDTKNSYWMVTLILDEKYGLDKDQLCQMMNEHDVDCRPFFRPLSSLPAYKHLEHIQKIQSENTVSYKIAPHGINLPSGLSLTQEKVNYVCDVLFHVLDN